VPLFGLHMGTADTRHRPCLKKTWAMFFSRTGDVGAQVSQLMRTEVSIFTAATGDKIPRIAGNIQIW